MCLGKYKFQKLDALFSVWGRENSGWLDLRNQVKEEFLPIAVAIQRKMQFSVAPDQTDQKKS